MNQIFENWKVYVHINKINNKAYVGITSQSLTGRWGSNGNGYTKKQVFYKAIQKYGWDNFEHILLEQNLSCEEASKKEKEYILKYNSLVPYGYNCAIGGYNNNISDFQRQNMSRLKSKKVICIEKNLVFDSAVDAGKYFRVTSKAILHAIRHKQKCCKCHWMNYQDFLDNGYEENQDRRNRKIICIETQQIYLSITEAERINNVYKGGISRCCNKLTKTCQGKHWAFYDEYLQTNGQIFVKPIKNIGKRTLCVETGEIFESMRQAGIEYKVTSGTIKAACDNCNRTAGGKHWKNL